MTRQSFASSLMNGTVSRRTALRGLGAAGVATALVAPTFTATGLARTGNPATSFARPLPEQATLAVQGAVPTAESLATWRMWFLSSADALRPTAPGAPSQEEIDEVVQAQESVSPEMTEAIGTWGTGLAIAPWSALAIALFAEFSLPPGPAQSRVLATLHTAMHDAAVAAWDAQVAHARPGPAATDSSIVPALGVNPEQPSFPSEHAAVAGAAAAVLSHLFADAAPGRFDDLASAAAESRIAAGASFRSDVEAGLTIGRAVAELAIAHDIDANDTGSWDPSTMPVGPGYWQPTPPAMIEIPFFPLAGLRTPWVLEGGDQFRPAPPPEHGSAAWRSELEAVQHVVANRSFDQDRLAIWWGTSSPILLFERWTLDLIVRAGSSLPQAARIMATVNTAIDDALISVWDGKFTYWTSRPVTEDPDLVMSVPTPPYPAFPGGYAGVMGAGSTVVGHFFPEVSVDMEQRAWEASCSRLWAGIHYPIDNDAGLLLGRQVGRMFTSRDQASTDEP